MITRSIIVFILLIHTHLSFSQKISNNDVSKLITVYKNDVRGPYYRIKWFCKNNTIREARDPCPDSIGGGLQHASFKASALQLRASNHLFFAEILAAENSTDVLDKTNNYSRLKQYQLGKYLASVDNGWVLRKAQYYRGAIQSEDEQAWGKAFFETILQDDEFITSHYYLIRQALRDIPHNGDSNVAQEMRSKSKVLSDEIPSFMDIRIKIHGKPENSDIYLVKDYYLKNKLKFSDKQNSEFLNLIKIMETFYAPIIFKDLNRILNTISENNNVTQQLLSFTDHYHNHNNGEQLVTEIANILVTIRQQLLDFKSSKNRLKVLDFSKELETIFLREIQNWHPKTINDILIKINTLACASYGTGLIEAWEYDTIKNSMYHTSNQKEIPITTLHNILNKARSIVEWSAATVKANYLDVVNTYADFEPLAYGFLDDRVRSSVALNFGETVGKLGVFTSKTSKIFNNVMSIPNQTTIRGLNPGYAFGELVVVSENPDNIEVNTNNIYVFEKPPSDLKPVAGIVTVSEGNLVSHVQLLARNLGIPNAALSFDNLKALKPYHGSKVFYAVSNQGSVIIKPETNMSLEEKALFKQQERSKNMIAVPVDHIKLDISKVINMRDVDATDSGKLCGPKAANLGALKKQFPKHVVEGIIIPFGIFRHHMNQQMPNENKSYWMFLNDIFKTANILKTNGKTDAEVEAFQLQALNTLYNAMLNIPLDTNFINDLKDSFTSIFGKNIGDIPVFLRSDTNMEDLKEFTGAGLNLTLFNILQEKKIIEGIKRVWASAYTERSFKWRQKYLLNPENVFPSILIIPSVDVDYSGVMITKGVNSGNEEDLTVAFSRGAGGAVDGQLAETRLITKNQSILLAPARQSDYIRLPKTGGTKNYYTSFENPILNPNNINDIKALAKDIRKTMAANHPEVKQQAYDVEFGFKDDKLWLFQIRPFVENKQAKSSEYLMSITPKLDSNKKINLFENI